MRVSGWLFGGMVALATPVLLRPRGLRAMVAGSGRLGTGAREWPRDALLGADTMLRLLGRLPIPGRPWRNSCLYRSASACAILRRHGYAAVLRLGVRQSGTSVAGIDAHAWVDVPGAPSPASASDFLAFEIGS